MTDLGCQDSFLDVVVLILMPWERVAQNLDLAQADLSYKSCCVLQPPTTNMLYTQTHTTHIHTVGIRAGHQLLIQCKRLRSHGCLWSVKAETTFASCMAPAQTAPLRQGLEGSLSRYSHCPEHLSYPLACLVWLGSGLGGV